MQIYKNGNGEIVIDGMGVTTVKIPKDFEGKQSVSDLVKSRINLEDDYLITGFCYEVEK